MFISLSVYSDMVVYSVDNYVNIVDLSPYIIYH